MNGVELIAEERKRQIEKEGWTAEHDDEHKYGTLAIAGACYAFDVAAHLETRSYLGSPMNQGLYQVAEDFWPFVGESMKVTTPDDPIRQLVKAGALIAAEIDRLQRLNNKESK